MEARYRRPLSGMAVPFLCLLVSVVGNAHPAAAQVGRGRSVAHGENFIVFASTPQLAEEVVRSAEQWRRDLAVHWLGHELPNWSQRCPIHVTLAANLGAGGETRFTLYGGAVGNWMMSVQGTPERIMDSVLPHEITHTIFASHFAPLNKHVPRWADEGACTTVEHASEQNKHKVMLNQFLQQGRGLSFNRMFSLKDYPRDILPLYAQGHAVVEFLLAQGGPQTFVKFVEQGLKTDNWEQSVRDQYGYETLGELKVKWNDWLIAGRKEVDLYVADSVAAQRSLGPVVSAVPAVKADRDQPEGPSVLLVASSVPGSVTKASDPPSLSASLRSPANPIGSRDTIAMNDSWYRQQLARNLRPIDRSGSVPQAVPHVAMPLQPYAIPHEASRPQPPQRPAVQILDAGNQWVR
ncbi:MAG: hypothetical protein U0892_08355 [Pirellulales bacterium]